MALRSSMFSSSAAGIASTVVVAVRARRRVVRESCMFVVDFGFGFGEGSCGFVEFC